MSQEGLGAGEGTSHKEWVLLIVWVSVKSGLLEFYCEQLLNVNSGLMLRHHSKSVNECE